MLIKIAELVHHEHDEYIDDHHDTNTIGGIIVAVVIIGILVIAINNFFPSFFAEMFESMKNKLNANW